MCVRTLPNTTDCAFDALLFFYVCFDDSQHKHNAKKCSPEENLATRTR